MYVYLFGTLRKMENCTGSCLNKPLQGDNDEKNIIDELCTDAIIQPILWRLMMMMMMMFTAVSLMLQSIRS